MKLKENFEIKKLLDYGFIEIDKDEAKENEDWVLSSFDYAFEIGHSRRGQFYYLLISKQSRTIHIYASDADGSGGIITAPNVLIKMSLDGVFETFS